MKPKIIFKIVIDFFMTVILLLLMAYMLTGQELHEWLGALMFVLVVIHNILNLRWYKNILKGRYTIIRIIQTVIIILVFVAMVVLMVSGIMMSRHVFGFLSISKGMSFARDLHMLASYWGFILMSCHLGLHWGMIMGVMRKVASISTPSRTRTIVLRVIAALIAAYGIYSFIKHDIATYMFLRSRFVFFDFEQSVFSFFAEYLAMMGLFVFIAYYATKLIQRYKSNKKQWKTKNKM